MPTCGLVPVASSAGTCAPRRDAPVVPREGAQQEG